MAEVESKGLLAKALGRSPNEPIDLSPHTRIHENIIFAFLLACGILSIFTTIGIVLVLLTESVAFFNRVQYEELNKRLIADVSVEETVLTITEAGRNVQAGDVLRLGHGQNAELVLVNTLNQNRFEQLRANLTHLGTGRGFERFCAGDMDLVDASRPMTAAERQTCLDNNITPVEFRIGIDALVVAVGSDNTFVDNVTLEELAQIFGEATLWSDVRSDWPSEPIQRFIPGTASGTFDYFVEEVFDGDEAAILSVDPITSENDDQIVGGINRNSPYAIGFFGFSYFNNNRNNLKALTINDIQPNAETAANGEYPLARPLFIYSSSEIMQAKPQVTGFINFFLQNVDDTIEDVGYFLGGDDALAEARQAWLDAMNAETLPEVDPSSYTGNIVYGGSSTVAPLTEELAEQFITAGFHPTIEVERGYEDTPITTHDAGLELERQQRVTLVEFFTHTVWQPLNNDFGVLPLVTATLMTSGIAMLVALPLGLGAAIYLSEYAPRRVRSTLKPILEILAGIPTVVYGYFALTVMTPLLRSIFGADVVGIYNTASAGIVVGVLIIPLVSSLSEDALSAVPRALREASYGLGATKLETVTKVVIPAALSGLLAAGILAVSRAIGETMIVALAAGAGPNLTLNPFEAAETMTGHIARISGGDISYDSIDYNSIYAIGLTLFVMTLGLNLISRAIINRFREAY